MYVLADTSQIGGNVSSNVDSSKRRVETKFTRERAPGRRALGLVSMAAAVAVAPVPFKDEDDDSSDDDFADELEAQLFEAEVKRDAVKSERDEGRDEEPSAKRVVRDAGRREEQHDGREGLATLPLELTLQILLWLSPEDLTSVGTTCKAMAFATADDSLWRRCFCSRFGHPKLTGVRSWRALYFQEDAR